jgi:hypothetical protein
MSSRDRAALEIFKSCTLEKDNILVSESGVISLMAVKKKDVKVNDTHQLPNKKSTWYRQNFHFDELQHVNNVLECQVGVFQLEPGQRLTFLQ